MKKSFTLIELPVARKRAFTLIELLVVIAIIGILSAVVLVAVNNAKKQAGDATVKSNMKQIRLLAENYKINKGSFSGLGQCNNTSNPLCNTAWVVLNGGDDVPDNSKTKILDLITKTEKTIGATASPKVLLKGGTSNFLILAILPSKIGANSSNTTWFCMDSLGGSKTYYGYAFTTPPDSPKAQNAWNAGYCI